MLRKNRSNAVSKDSPALSPSNLKDIKLGKNTQMLGNLELMLALILEM